MFRRYFHTTGSQLRPSIVEGFYPQRNPEEQGWLEKFYHSLAGSVSNLHVPVNKYNKIIREISAFSEEFQGLDEHALGTRTTEIRRGLHQYGLTRALTVEAFALVREVADRTLKMRHYDTQMIGAWIMVHGGLAEMETGEGKTLTATLAAATAALAGIPVHIVTVNDYLVTRDAEEMAPLYQKLGLSVGAVTGRMDGAVRRKGYASDITYCTNKLLAFDYLRDRMLMGSGQGKMRMQVEKMHATEMRSKRLFLRGLCYAIVDEADSVLIDEARTPLLISRKANSADEEMTYSQALEVAKKFRQREDFNVDRLDRTIHLTDKGCEYLDSFAGITAGGVWSGKRRREELVQQALAALHLYRRDHHYVVQNGKVLIVDQNTGRLMADRSWERGLHQMIELKENCEMSGRNEPLARMTYQRFFRRYLCLAGMTGTAREVQRELWSVYGLRVSRVAPHKPSQRRCHGHHVYRTKALKWNAVVTKTIHLHRRGQPVLLGTRSVADSELISSLLKDNDLSCQVLNARQDSLEAEIVAKAGGEGAITVATNMAGRGTDIPLGSGVVELGGLHVISTELNEAKRIDRQLFGRCGRQGDPGSYEEIFSLEDELLQPYLEKVFSRTFIRILGKSKVLAHFVGPAIMRLAQAAVEKHHVQIRKNLVHMDEQLGRLLAFSGRLE